MVAGKDHPLILRIDHFYDLLFTVLSSGQVGLGLRGDSQPEPENIPLPLRAQTENRIITGVGKRCEALSIHSSDGY